MSKQIITAQDTNGTPLGDFFVNEECGIDNPKHWLKGELRFAACGNSVSLHVDFIAVRNDEKEGQFPCDSAFNADIESVFQLNGSGPLMTLRIGEFDYVVVIYPYAE